MLGCAYICTYFHATISYFEGRADNDLLENDDDSPVWFFMLSMDTALKLISPLVLSGHSLYVKTKIVLENCLLGPSASFNALKDGWADAAPWDDSLYPLSPFQGTFFAFCGAPPLFVVDLAFYKTNAQPMKKLTFSLSLSSLFLITWPLPI